MRGISINPWLKNVSYVEIDLHDVETLYRALSWMEFRATIVSIVSSYPNGDNLVVSSADPEMPIFRLGTQIVYGMGVILGANEERQWTDAMFTLSEIQTRIRFN